MSERVNLAVAGQQLPFGGVKSPFSERVGRGAFVILFRRFSWTALCRAKRTKAGLMIGRRRSERSRAWQKPKLREAFPQANERGTSNCQGFVSCQCLFLNKRNCVLPVMADTLVRCRRIGLSDCVDNGREMEKEGKKSHTYYSPVSSNSSPSWKIFRKCIVTERFDRVRRNPSALFKNRRAAMPKWVVQTVSGRFSQLLYFLGYRIISRNEVSI